MFGYVRPLRDELKCRDFDLYRSVYCGLCHTMGRRYGWIAPFFLNYDFTFLALLLEPAQTTAALCQKRCHINPLQKRTMCAQSVALERSADESIILTWWQLQDRIQDSRGWERWITQGVSWTLRGAYRKAERLQPHFVQVVQQQLQALNKLEQEGCTSMDQAAHCFATLLTQAAPQTGEQRRDRAMAQLLYHLGRWIYLIDAQEDWEEDARKGTYNAVTARFGGRANQEELVFTLNYSLNLMCSAAQLIDFGCRWPLIENILYLGLPLVQKAVLEGSWKAVKNQRIWRRKA